MASKINAEFGSVKFSSDFDSGNLARVEQVPGTSGRGFEFDVWTAPDCAGTEFANSNRTWFHFNVVGIPPGETLSITVKNLNKQTRLYQQGMAPVVRLGRGRWERVRRRPSYEFADGQFALSFSYTFPTSGSASQEAFFAFTYPHSYATSQRQIGHIQQKLVPSADPLSARAEDIYFHREVLCRSLEGRSVDLITVTSHYGITQEREARLERLFPQEDMPRPHRFANKKVCFVSSRVHPGEVASSFVCKGFLNFILRTDDPRAAELRRTYVFKIVPMLNPDGVERGHYRTDTRGVNLNRVYQNPNIDLHPTVYATRRLILYHHFYGSHLDGCAMASWTMPQIEDALKQMDENKSAMPGVEPHCCTVLPCTCRWSNGFHRTSGLALYLDLHGHAQRRGCFIYGNNFLNPEDQAECMLFPKLVSMNSAHFDFEACNFSKHNMKMKDKNSDSSKEGSGRVALYQATGLIHCYTLECNYNTGRAVNRLSPATADNGSASPPPSTTLPPKYTPAIYEQVGQAVAVALLDILGINPWSRIPNSSLNTLSAIRQWLLKYSASKFGKNGATVQAQPARKGETDSSDEDEQSARPTAEVTADVKKPLAEQKARAVCAPGKNIGLLSKRSSTTKKGVGVTRLSSCSLPGNALTSTSAVQGRRFTYPTTRAVTFPEVRRQASPVRLAYSNGECLLSHSKTSVTLLPDAKCSVKSREISHLPASLRSNKPGPHQPRAGEVLRSSSLSQFRAPDRLSSPNTVKADDLLVALNIRTKIPVPQRLLSARKRC